MAKFFILKNSKTFGGPAITSLGDSNPNDATDLTSCKLSFELLFLTILPFRAFASHVCGTMTRAAILIQTDNIL